LVTGFCRRRRDRRTGGRWTAARRLLAIVMHLGWLHVRMLHILMLDKKI